LERALDSLCDQTFKDFDVLICDDGSEDGCFEALSPYFQRLSVTYLFQDNSGSPAAARNMGLAVSDHKYIAFLDSDDWWLPTKLEESVRRLEKGLDLVFHDLRCSYGGRSIFRSSVVRSRSISADPYTFLIKHGNVIPTSSVVARGSVLKRAGLQSSDISHRGWEDYEYWLRVSRESSLFERIPHRLGFYSVSEEGDSSNQDPADLILRVRASLFPPHGPEPGWIAFAEGVALMKGGNLSGARRRLWSAVFSRDLRLRTDRLRCIKFLLATFVPRSKASMKGT
jgi:glycosyltransferase involved in cell wall biosynthesis